MPEGFSDADEYRRRLYDVMASDDSLAEKQEAALAIGREYLGVEDAFVARVDEANGEKVILASVGEPGNFVAGDVLDLSTTYCRRTVESDSPVALHDTPEQGWEDDPAWQEHRLRCYLGARVVVDGEPFGTACFVDRDAHSQFDEAERTFVELIARLVGHEIERERFRAAIADREGIIDDRESAIRDREATIEDRERDLERSETKYESLVRASPDALVVVDDEAGEIVEVNEATVELTGYDLDDLVGASLFDLVPSTDVERYEASFERFESAERAVSTFDDDSPFCVETATGEEIPVEISGRAVELDGDRYRQYLIRDVSERRERIEDLREREETFRGITETSFDIIFRLDRTGRFTFVSQAVERHLAYDPDDLVGESITAIMADDEDVARALGGFEQVLDGETVEGLRLTVQRPDGSEAILELNGTPVREHEGVSEAVVGVQGVARDVTQRVERQRELRVKNRAIDSANVGITIADASEPDTPLVYANDRFLAMTGYEEDEILGRNCRFLQGSDTDPEEVATMRDAIESLEPTTVELLNYRKSGEPFWSRVSLTPVEDDSGTVTHFVGFQQDVTPERRRDRLLEVLNRVLRHNLRNDMNVVMGMASTLASALDGEQAQRARTIYETACDLNDLSESARDLQQAVQATATLEPLNVCPTVREAALEVRESFPDATVRVDAPPERVAVASEHLWTVLRELGRNAAEHAGDEPSITFSVPTDDPPRIVVEDDGPGLPEQERATLDQGYETPLTHGSGLGLWLTDWLVTGMGGNVDVADDAAGTRIVVTLQDPQRAGGRSDWVRPIVEVD